MVSLVFNLQHKKHTAIAQTKEYLINKKKIVNKISLLILLPIDDHQYIHPYKIKESLNKSLKGFKEIETCVNINEALRLILTKFKNGKILICGSLYLAGQVLKNDGFKIN